MTIPLSIGEEQNYGDARDPIFRSTLKKVEKEEDNNFADSFWGIIITELHVKTPDQNTDPS